MLPTAPSQARLCPRGALAPLSGPKTLPAPHGGATGPASSPAHCPFSDHICSLLFPDKGWLSGSAGSRLSPLECVRIFRKRVVSDVRPGRAKDYPRFPTPPPSAGFAGKAVSVYPLPSVAASCLCLQDPKPAGRQRRQPGANSSQHWSVHFG